MDFARVDYRWPAHNMAREAFFFPVNGRTQKAELLLAAIDSSSLAW